MDLEARMAFPREHLNFTLWYLKTRRLVTMEDNSDFGLTVEGLDYLEKNSANNRVIRAQLGAGPLRDDGDSPDNGERVDAPYSDADMSEVLGQGPYS